MSHKEKVKVVCEYLDLDLDYLEFVHIDHEFIDALYKYVSSKRGEE